MLRARSRWSCVEKIGTQLEVRVGQPLVLTANFDARSQLLGGNRVFALLAALNPVAQSGGISDRRDGLPPHLLLLAEATSPARTTCRSRRPTTPVRHVDHLILTWASLVRCRSIWAAAKRL